MMMDIEAQIKPRLAAMGGSIALLAYLVGCSKTVLSQAANGTASLSRETALRVDSTLRELEEFIRSVSAIKADLRDARSVEAWLSEFRHSKKKSDPWSLLKDLTANDADTVCAH